MATLKSWLNDLDFDWESGRIIYQETEGSFCGWDTPIAAMEIGKDDPVLTREFCDGFGGPECPRIVAEDAVAIYFPSQYDGATRLEKIWKDLSKYLDVKCLTPYPGG